MSHEYVWKPHKNVWKPHESGRIAHENRLLSHKKNAFPNGVTKHEIGLIPHEKVLMSHESRWTPHESGLKQHDNQKLDFYYMKISLKNSNAGERIYSIWNTNTKKGRISCMQSSNLASLQSSSVLILARHNIYLALKPFLM